jgi:hypothetical protein
VFAPRLALSNATFTVAANALNMGIANVLLQYHGGGLQFVSYWARRPNSVERGYSDSAYDLEALVVYKAVKHRRRYLEGCSKLLMVTGHDTPRPMPRQPTHRLKK